MNPIVEEEGTFDITDDYPRRDVVDYREAVKEGKREEATVIRATFVFDKADIDIVAEEFGTKALSKDAMVQLSKGYDNESSFRLSGFNTQAALEFVVANSNVPADVGEQVKAVCDSDVDPASSKCLLGGAPHFWDLF